MPIVIWTAAAFVLLSAYIAAEALYYQRLLGPALERELGFCKGTAIRPRAGVAGYEAAVAIVEVAEGGAFDRAGFRAGDVMPEESHSSFFKSLHRRRGGVARFRVADGGEGLPFRGRPMRELEVAVPARRFWRER